MRRYGCRWREGSGAKTTKMGAGTLVPTAGRQPSRRLLILTRRQGAQAAELNRDWGEQR
jgi:hypothetical protein